MKQDSPQKQAFYNLLNRAVGKDEKAVSQKQKQKKDAGYKKKRIGQRKIVGA